THRVRQVPRSAVRLWSSQPISLLDSGQPGIRHAPSLINVRFRPRLMWDGRFRSLEEQAFDPFRPNSEMGISIEQAAGQISLDPSYSAQFFHVSHNRPPRMELFKLWQPMNARWSPALVDLTGTSITRINSL